VADKQNINLRWAIVGLLDTDVLLRHHMPVLCSFDHPAAVNGTEAKPVVDVVTGTIPHPPCLQPIGNSRRLHHYVL